MMNRYSIKKFSFLISIIFCVNISHATLLTPKVQKNELKFAYNFDEWNKACQTLPSYKPCDIRAAQFKKHKKIISAEELQYALDNYFAIMLNDSNVFLNKNNWINCALPNLLIKNLSEKDSKEVFDPFVEKVVLNDKSVVAFHGDIHGDVHSLLAFLSDLEKRKLLKNFEIINSNFYMVFLGDYTDRGLYGPEVIYTILRLKIANPHKVFLVRGNHEQLSQNKSDKDDEYYYECFWSQLEMLFNQDDTFLIFKKILKMYESMPLALYLGAKGVKSEVDFILCCHGGIEIGFDPYKLLNHPSDHAFTKLGTLDRLSQLQKLNNKENETILNLFTKVNKYIRSFDNILVTMENNYVFSEPFLKAFVPQGLATAKFCPHFECELPVLIGFQWNDYEVTSIEKDLCSCFVRNSLGRGFVIGKTFNEAMLKLNSDKKNIVHGVFRAHQHVANPQDPMMRRILNKDNLDSYMNRGIGKLWIDKESDKYSPQQLWDNIVCTFNVSPNTIYQIAGYQEDTYGLLKLGKGYHNWRLEVINQKTVA